MMDLLNVKQDFISMVQRAQPFTLSHFIMWLDLKVAEYKVFGYMKLDQSAGTVPQIYNSPTEQNPSRNAPVKLSTATKDSSEPGIVLVPNQREIQRGISADGSSSRKAVGKMLRKHVYTVNKYSTYNRTIPSRMNNKHAYVRMRRSDQNSHVEGSQNLIAKDTHGSSPSDNSKNAGENEVMAHSSESQLSVKNEYTLVDEGTEPTGLYQNISNIISSDLQDCINRDNGESSTCLNSKTACDQVDAVQFVTDMDNGSAASNLTSVNPDWEHNFDNSNLMSDQSADITRDSSSPADSSVRSQSHDGVQIKIEPDSDDCLLIHVTEVQEPSVVSKQELTISKCDDEQQLPGVSDTSIMRTYSDHVPNMYLTDHETASTYHPRIDCQSQEPVSPFIANFVGTEKAPRNPVTGMLICSQCGASFKCRSSLSRHKALHGEKRHHCFICQRAFHRKEHLYTHLDRHAKNSEIACPVCHIQGPNMQYIEKHYTQVHGPP